MQDKRMNDFNEEVVEETVDVKKPGAFRRFWSKKHGKAITIATCGALVVALGFGSINVIATGTSNGNGSRQRIMAEVVDGVVQISKDGGETWTTDIPEGINYTINEDGTVTINRTKGNKNGRRACLMAVVRDGVVQFSKDGGETWTTEAPEGINYTVNEDGTVSIERIKPMLEIRDGVVQISRDGGETWSTDIPEGLNYTVNDDGTVTIERNREGSKGRNRGNGRGTTENDNADGTGDQL